MIGSKTALVSRQSALLLEPVVALPVFSDPLLDRRRKLETTLALL
jgi:hypothetical protein